MNEFVKIDLNSEDQFFEKFMLNRILLQMYLPKIIVGLKIKNI
ncbi:Uncharacterised protein [Priestia megaterium]|nr:Uncharacterised protein [Priestia megaterium]